MPLRGSSGLDGHSVQVRRDSPQILPEENALENWGVWPEDPAMRKDSSVDAEERGLVLPVDVEDLVAECFLRPGIVTGPRIAKLRRSPFIEYCLAAALRTLADAACPARPGARHQAPPPSGGHDDLRLVPSSICQISTGGTVRFSTGVDTDAASSRPVACGWSASTRRVIGRLCPLRRSTFGEGRLT